MALAAEMARADRNDVRLTTRRYFEYLDRYGTLAGRLCRSGVRAEVVFGENDEVGWDGSRAQRARVLPNNAPSPRAELWTHGDEPEARLGRPADRSGPRE